MALAEHGVGRLASLEASVETIRGLATENSTAIARLSTHLTGEGIKGSGGVLGEIAENMLKISDELRKLNEQRELDRESRDSVIAKEVQAQLARRVIVRDAGFWNTQTKLMKWLIRLVIAGFMSAITYVIVVDVTQHIGNVPGH